MAEPAGVDHHPRHRFRLDAPLEQRRHAGQLLGDLPLEALAAKSRRGPPPAVARRVRSSVSVNASSTRMAAPSSSCYACAYRVRPPGAGAVVSGDIYNPQNTPASVRLTAYSANLLTLIVCATGAIAADELYGDETSKAIRYWTFNKTLSRSQIPPGGVTRPMRTLSTLHRHGPAGQMDLHQQEPRNISTTFQ